MMENDAKFVHPSSFRDESGYIFKQNGEIYRALNHSYKFHYDLLLSSGLYSHLVSEGLLIAHEEVDGPKAAAYKIIKPEQIPVISFPYEWCFDQLKDAALLTLRIQQESLKFGLILKDSSAFNVQFIGSKPIFIDTLSFEKYHEGEPWKAYRQFCQHFLAPLLLMSKVDRRLSLLFNAFIDGIPLDLTASLLPLKSYLSFSQLTHIHLQSASIRKFNNSEGRQRQPARVSRFNIEALIDNLMGAVNNTRFAPVKTQWADYYDFTNYSDEGFEKKRSIVKTLLANVSGRTALDLGANDGRFSKLLEESGFYTISTDIDHEAIRRNYQFSKTENSRTKLSLILDFTNPSAGIGWQNSEREPFFRRCCPDVVLALALIHHLVFTHNISLDMIARAFASVTSFLIIEFVPANDSQVQLLPKGNPGMLETYTEDHFRSTFLNYFTLIDAISVSQSSRKIFLYRKK